jgi:hypothetical protein
MDLKRFPDINRINGLRSDEGKGHEVTEVGRKGMLCSSLFTILSNTENVHYEAKNNPHGVMYDDE